MPKRRDGDDDALEAAVALAREIAPELRALLLTHYADHDTLDTLRPGETDLAAAGAVNRDVARAMAAEGVEIIVQKANRAAFRRWMQGRESTPENRRRWIDRGNLLRGEAAHRLIGIDPPPAPRRPSFGKAPGPIATALLAAFDGEDTMAFERQVEALLAAGRDDVLDLALRKLDAAEGEDAAAELESSLLAIAEGGHFGPASWAELVVLPVALPSDALPDAAELGSSLLRSDVLAETDELRLLPGWRAPDAIAALPPLALRRVLLDLVAGREPADLPPGDSDDLRQRGFGALLGLRIDWDIPIWDEIAATGFLPEEDTDAEDEAPEVLFDRWREATFEGSGNCVPLALVPPSEVEAEIADFLEEAEGHAAGIEDIQAFVTVGRQEAGSDDVVCRVEVVGEDLELSLYTEQGRFLDSVTVPADRLPARAEEMSPLIAAFVRVVKDTPGR